MTRHESFLIYYVVIMTHILPWPSMVFYPIRIRMCPNLLMVRPSQGHVLLIRLSYLMIRTCIGKQMDTCVRDTLDGEIFDTHFIYKASSSEMTRSEVYDNKLDPRTTTYHATILWHSSSSSLFTFSYFLKTCVTLIKLSKVKPIRTPNGCLPKACCPQVL